MSAATLQENFKLKQYIETIQSDVDSVVEEVNKLKQEKEELIKMLERIHDVNKHHGFNGHMLNDQIFDLIQKHKGE